MYLGLDRVLALCVCGGGGGGVGDHYVIKVSLFHAKQSSQRAWGCSAVGLYLYVFSKLNQG